MNIVWPFFWLIWFLGILLIVTYAVAMMFGAPFLPTLKAQREQAFELLDLKKGQTFVDLGSGDGIMLVMAAKRGYKAVGYEINPFLVIYSWLRTRRFGLRVKVKMVSFWRADISNADGLYIFLITHHMKHFAQFINDQAPTKELKVVSNSFEIPGKRPSKKLGPMFLYKYPKVAP